jgi:hypothetical protein
MRSRGEVVVRVWGGLGNQLFLYAVARRLSLMNGVPLKLDIHSGFERDTVYRRRCLLHHFNIAGTLATRSEAWETAPGRVWRALWRSFGRHLPVERRTFLTDDDPDCRAGILTMPIRSKVYLEGYWQDENYFKDIASTIRADFQIVSPHSAENMQLAEIICRDNSVCIHSRLLPGANTPDAKPEPGKPVLSLNYYRRAIERIAGQVREPHFFCFSDYPDWLRENLKIDYPVTYVSHNRGDEKSYEDFWLMSQCKYFIIANSTFSWWAAWLAVNPDKRVLVPNMKRWQLPELIRPFELLEDS